MAIATGLIFAQLNIASPRDIPFCKLQQLQCLHHHGSTEAHLCILQCKQGPFLRCRLLGLLAKHSRPGSKTKHSDTPC